MTIRVAIALACALAAVPARADFADHWATDGDVGTNKAPRLGASRLLVVPVEVRNQGYAPLDRGALERFFTERSTTEFRFRSYFETASQGRFTPEVVVAPTVAFDRCPASVPSCALDKGDAVTLRNSGVALLRAAFGRIDEGCFAANGTCDAEAAIDFSLFDESGLYGHPDGWNDGVLVVTNIPGIALSLPLATVNPADDGDLADGRGGAFILDDTKIGSVALCGTDAGQPASAAFRCVRQFGALLGLSDLGQEFAYATAHPDDRYRGLELSGVGAWRGDEKAVLPDAESRYRLGWGDVEVVTGTRTITLEQAAAGGGIVKLGVQYGDRREYFLVEARGPLGPYDRNLVRADGSPVYGLAVYRVDWSRGPTAQDGGWLYRLINCPNCDPWHPFVMNVQADRKFDLQDGGAFKAEDDLFLAGDVFEPTRNVEPLRENNRVWGSNFYDGTPSGIAIRNIRVDQATGAITADFEAPLAENVCADVVCSAGFECNAGNCRRPEQVEVPVEPIPQAQPEKAAAEGGWGCTSVRLPGLMALALVVLQRRRRR